MSTRVAVVEDVWGPAFESLAQRMDVVRAPNAWQYPAVLARTASAADALVVRNRTTVVRRLSVGVVAAIFGVPPNRRTDVSGSQF